MNIIPKHLYGLIINTFRESVRDRILFVAAGFALFIISFSLFIGSISLDQGARIVANAGIVAIFLLQVFIAIFVGTTLIYKEVEMRTFFMILTKPVTRSSVMLGKFLGLSLVNAVMTVLTAVVFFAVLWVQSGTVTHVPLLLLAIVLGFIEALVLTMIGLFFSALTSPVLAAFYTIAVFLIGHSSGSLLDVIAKQSGIFKFALYALYYAFPSFDKLSMRNEAIYGVAPSYGHIWFAVLYALAYGYFVFIAARLIFDRRQF